MKDRPTQPASKAPARRLYWPGLTVIVVVMLDPSE
jgi:hypothetical protein